MCFYFFCVVLWFDLLLFLFDVFFVNLNDVVLWKFFLEIILGSVVDWIWLSWVELWLLCEVCFVRIGVRWNLGLLLLLSLILIVMLWFLMLVYIILVGVIWMWIWILFVEISFCLFVFFEFIGFGDFNIIYFNFIGNWWVFWFLVRVFWLLLFYDVVCV